MAISRLSGSRFATFGASTSVSYPSDGSGAVTTTNTSSEISGAPEVVIDAIVVTQRHTAATTFKLFQHDGTTQIGPDITIGQMAAISEANQPLTISFGPNGLRVAPQSGNANFGFSISNTATKGFVVYRRVRRGG